MSIHYTCTYKLIVLFANTILIYTFSGVNKRLINIQ